MTNTLAPTLLPDEWKSWLKLNLDRGCHVTSLLADMERSGQFSREVALAAIRAIQNKEPAFSELPLPNVATSSNALTIRGRDIRVLMTCSSPRIVLLGNVLSDVECDALINLAMPKFERSLVVGANGSNELFDGRSSRGAYLHDTQSDIKSEIEARLSDLTNWPLENGEGLQLLRYDVGGEYTPHFDWFEPGTTAGDHHLKFGGQRVGTLILYLSEVDEGGVTSFPSLGLDFYPQKGSALFFQNTDDAHTGDRMTLHAGGPVVKGVKYIANKWLRAGKFGAI